MTLDLGVVIRKVIESPTATAPSTREVVQLPIPECVRVRSWIEWRSLLEDMSHLLTQSSLLIIEIGLAG